MVIESETILTELEVLLNACDSGNLVSQIVFNRSSYGLTHQQASDLYTKYRVLLVNGLLREVHKKDLIEEILDLSKKNMAQTREKNGTPRFQSHEEGQGSIESTLPSSELTNLLSTDLTNADIYDAVRLVTDVLGIHITSGSQWQTFIRHFVTIKESLENFPTKPNNSWSTSIKTIRTVIESIVVAHEELKLTAAQLCLTSAVIGILENQMPNGQNQIVRMRDMLEIRGIVNAKIKAFIEIHSNLAEDDQEKIVNFLQVNQRAYAQTKAREEKERQRLVALANAHGTSNEDNEGTIHHPQLTIGERPTAQATATQDTAPVEKALQWRRSVGILLIIAITCLTAQTPVGQFAYDNLPPEALAVVDTLGEAWDSSSYGFEELIKYLYALVENM